MKASIYPIKNVVYEGCYLEFQDLILIDHIIDGIKLIFEILSYKSVAYLPDE